MSMVRALLVAVIVLFAASATPAKACWGWRYNTGYCDNGYVTPYATLGYYPGSSCYYQGSYYGCRSYYSGYGASTYYYPRSGYGWGYGGRRLGRWGRGW
jgi:hypothetical protein